MDTVELRAAFLQGASLREGFEQRREDFLLRVAQRETPLPLIEGCKAQLMIQVIPFAALSPGSTVDLRKISIDDLKPVTDFGGRSDAYCWEGYMVHTGGRQAETGAYTLARRDGSLEGVDVYVTTRAQGNLKVLCAEAIEKALLGNVPHLLESLGALGQSPPVAVLVTLRGVLGAVIDLGPGVHGPTVPPLRLDVLRLPQVTLDSFQADLGEAFKDSFDAMWQACGWPGSRRGKG